MQRMYHQVHVHNFKHRLSGLGLNHRKLEWGTVDTKRKRKEGKGGLLCSTGSCYHRLGVLTILVGLEYIAGFSLGAVWCSLGYFWVADTARLTNGVSIDIFSAAPLLTVSTCS